jgi:hypothetical protein
MKSLSVLTLFFVTAIAFAQNEPTVEQRCEEIVGLEADLGELLVKYTEKHPQIVRLREEIEAQRAELRKASPGYVCKSPIATLSEIQQTGDQRAGIIVTQPNVTQPNIPQPNMPQPNVRSLGCDAVLAAQKRVSEYRREIVLRADMTYTEEHPAMVELSSREDAMRAEMSNAASQGVDCSAANQLFVCDRIWFFERQQQARQQTGKHALSAFRQNLSTAAAHLAGERARAASLGIDCPATEPEPENTEAAAAEPGL